MSSPLHAPCSTFATVRRLSPIGRQRLAPAEFVRPGVVHRGRPIAVDEVLARLGSGFHGAFDPVEGAVWRVERAQAGTLRVILVAKFVRRDKLDGALLPENTGQPAIWNC